MDILSLFDIFNKTNRKIIPLSLYLGYEQDGEDTGKNGKDMTFANSNDFPEELFDKIIIMTKDCMRWEYMRKKRLLDL